MLRRIRGIVMQLKDENVNNTIKFLKTFYTNTRDSFDRKRKRLAEKADRGRDIDLTLYARYNAQINHLNIILELLNKASKYPVSDSEKSTLIEILQRPMTNSWDTGVLFEEGDNGEFIPLLSSEQKSYCDNIFNTIINQAEKQKQIEQQEQHEAIATEIKAVIAVLEDAIKDLRNIQSNSVIAAISAIESEMRILDEMDRRPLQNIASAQNRLVEIHSALNKIITNNLMTPSNAPQTIKVGERLLDKLFKLFKLFTSGIYGYKNGEMLTNSGTKCQSLNMTATQNTKTLASIMTEMQEKINESKSPSQSKDSTVANSTVILRAGTILSFSA